MNEDILADIRNKLTVPRIALERLAKGEKVPSEFLELALEELNSVINAMENYFRKMNPLR